MVQLAGSVGSDPFSVAVASFQANGPALTNLVMGLMVQRDNKVVRMVAHIDGRVAPGQQFRAEFKLPESLAGANLKQLPTRFYVDDVEPSQ